MNKCSRQRSRYATETVCSWVAWSRSGSSSFTASALNKVSVWPHKGGTSRGQEIPIQELDLELVQQIILPYQSFKNDAIGRCFVFSKWVHVGSDSVVGLIL